MTDLSLTLEPLPAIDAKPAASGSRLRNFLLVSLCLHIAGFMAGFLSGRVSLPRYLAPQTSAISVDLVGDPGPVTKRTAARSVTTPVSVTPNTATAQATTTGSAPVAASGGDRGETSTAAQTASAASIETAIQAQLRLDFQRYFSYPPLATWRNWEGTVRLAFVIDADGMLREIHVDAGSGYDVLDESALATLHRVGRLNNAERWLHGRPLAMNLAVAYRLKDR